MRNMSFRTFHKDNEQNELSSRWWGHVFFKSCLLGCVTVLYHTNVIRKTKDAKMLNKMGKESASVSLQCRWKGKWISLLSCWRERKLYWQKDREESDTDVTWSVLCSSFSLFSCFVSWILSFFSRWKMPEISFQNQEYILVLLFFLFLWCNTKERHVCPVSDSIFFLQIHFLLLYSCICTLVSLDSKVLFILTSHLNRSFRIWKFCVCVSYCLLWSRIEWTQSECVWQAKWTLNGRQDCILFFSHPKAPFVCSYSLFFLWTQNRTIFMPVNNRISCNSLPPFGWIYRMNREDTHTFSPLSALFYFNAGQIMKYRSSSQKNEGKEEGSERNARHHSEWNASESKRVSHLRVEQ